MERILQNPDNAEKLLKLTSDSMILIDKDGVCVDIAIHNVDLWFLKEEKLLGKNIFQLLPSNTYNELYPDFKKVLTKKVTSTKNYSLTLGNETYFFKSIMRPYDNMVICQYRDITERTQQKLQLEKRNYELKEIQKAALIGRWRYNTKEKNFYYKGHTGVMCTEDEQSIQIDQYISLILPEDLPSFNHWLVQNIQGDMKESVDYRIRFNKKVFYIRLKSFSRERHNNESVILEGYIQNITDIQQKRNDINLLTHAINNSNEDIFAAKKDGTLIFANRQFKEHHNIGSIDNIQILDLKTFVKNKNIWKEVLVSLKEKPTDYSFIIYNPLESHPEILAYEGNAYLVTSDEGEETVWAFGRDISQRILHEQEIKRFSQVMDKTIEHLPAGIVVKDIKNSFKYLYRNRESYNRNVNMQKALGKSDFDFYPPEVATEKRRKDIEIATTGQEMHWVEQETDKNGKILFLDKRKMKIESEDFPPILLSIEWDITEMETMKRELLIAKEKAETSDQLKSAFLANMSHEIRTPLNAIVGFSRIIAENEDAEERKSYYDIVEVNNERLLQLINEILDLSKIEAGIVEFSTSNVHLHSLCKEIYDAHVFRCPSGVQLIFEPSDENINIDSDKNRLFQVMSNLIGNAFKFTVCGNISYGYCRKGEYIELHVSDTGTGIAADKIGKVFERFVKANNFAQGTGLGLAICKTIIERLGGSISVTSEVDKGTTFSLTLPAKTNENIQKSIPVEINDLKKAKIEVSISKENAPQKTILVAEDTDSNYILTRAVLGKLYRLIRAENGMKAVTMFEEIHPDLILMDIKMPNLGGLEATKIIREISKDVPIIALTAFAYDNDRQAAFDAGCNDFLTKPFTQEGIKDMVKKWLNEE